MKPRTLLVVLAVSLPTAASTTPSCMTYREARAQWPRLHLWWHDVHRHCWDNHGPVRHKKQDKLPMDASGNRLFIDADEIMYRQEAEARLNVCCWPPMPEFEPWQVRVAGLFN